MNDYIFNGIKIGATGLIIKVMTSIMLSVVPTDDVASGPLGNLAGNLSGMVDIITYLPLVLSSIFIIIGLGVAMGLGPSVEQSNIQNTTPNKDAHNNVQVVDNINNPSINDTTNDNAATNIISVSNDVESHKEINQADIVNVAQSTPALEEPTLDIALMSSEEKIHYYLEQINYDRITQKTQLVLQKHHLVNEFLEDNAILVGLKEDNDKILSTYLPKVLENHFKLNHSMIVATNLINHDPNNQVYEQKHLDETLYQLDILEKGLDNMIDTNQQNATDEASMMRLFLEKKFSAALPSELSSLDMIENTNNVNVHEKEKQEDVKNLTLTNHL